MQTIAPRMRAPTTGALWLVRNSCPSQCLSNWFLKEFSEEASMQLGGREFHSGTTLCENTESRTAVLLRGVASVSGCCRASTAGWPGRAERRVSSGQRSGSYSPCSIVVHTSPNQQNSVNLLEFIDQLMRLDRHVRYTFIT